MQYEQRWGKLEKVHLGLNWILLWSQAANLHCPEKPPLTWLIVLSRKDILLASQNSIIVWIQFDTLSD